jgi:hypothetical protein
MALADLLKNLFSPLLLCKYLFPNHCASSTTLLFFSPLPVHVWDGARVVCLEEASYGSISLIDEISLVTE